MPILLKGSHSHAFAFTSTDTGEVVEVKVLRGQDIEDLPIGRKRLSQLLSEYVPTFDGTSRKPRYEYSEVVEDEDGSTYTSGVITAALATKNLRTKVEKDKDKEGPDFRQMQRDAEAAEAAEAQADLREEAEANAAAKEQAEREAVEQAERAQAAEAKLAALEASIAAQSAVAKDPEASAPSAPTTPAANTPSAPRKAGRPAKAKA